MVQGGNSRCGAFPWRPAERLYVTCLPTKSTMRHMCTQSAESLEVSLRNETLYVSLAHVELAVLCQRDSAENVSPLFDMRDCK